MNKQDCLGAWEDQIRLARQVFHVQAVAEANAVKEPPYPHFGLGIAAMNARHIAATLLGRVDVGHSSSTISRPIASITLGTTALPNWR